MHKLDLYTLATGEIQLNSARMASAGARTAIKTAKNLPSACEVKSKCQYQPNYAQRRHQQEVQQKQQQPDRKSVV